MIRSILAAAGLAVALGVPAAAEGLKAVQTVEELVLSVGPDGEVVETFVPAQLVSPGEEVRYTLTYTNDGEREAANVVLVMPIPEDVVFVEGSARIDGAIVDFSADGGATFSERGEVAVSQGGQPRSALAEDLTHVRWTFPEPVPASEEGAVSFRAVVR